MRILTSFEFDELKFFKRVACVQTLFRFTIDEHTSNNDKTGGVKSNFIGGFSIAHIKQHFFADSSKPHAPQPKNKRKR